MVDFFSLLGIKLEWCSNQLLLKKFSNAIIPEKIEWNFNNNPDLYPTILVACLGLGVELCTYGIKTLAHKESNRIISMKRELSKFNCIIDVKSEDSVYFKPGKLITKEKIITIETYNDHRIALALSPLVLLGYKLKISNPDVINKSYPNFWFDLVKFGVKIKKYK